MGVTLVTNENIPSKEYVGHMGEMYRHNGNKSVARPRH
jgi:hypothetical protein